MTEKTLYLSKCILNFSHINFFELLNDSARQEIEQNSQLYTWSSVDGTEEETDGLTTLAIILGCIHPNFKVDMYAEIGMVKKLTISHTAMTFSCTLTLSSSSSLRLIKRIPRRTLKTHSFKISFFNSSTNHFHLIFGLSSLAKKLAG